MADVWVVVQHVDFISVVDSVWTSEDAAVRRVRDGMAAVADGDGSVDCMTWLMDPTPDGREVWCEIDRYPLDRDCTDPDWG